MQFRNFVIGGQTVSVVLDFLEEIIKPGTDVKFLDSMNISYILYEIWTSASTGLYIAELR
jgi:hypothetical protein